MAYRFNPPPGWDVPEGFTPDEGWQPDPSWPAAPAGWEFWLPEPVAAPPPPPPGAGTTAAASQKLSGMFKSLKTKAQDEDWMGKAKTAASQAASSAQDAASKAAAAAKQRDEAALDSAGPVPEGALWRGVSHEAGRNSIVTLYPDRIERTKPTSKFSLTGMLTGGPEDVEVIPTRSVSSVQVRRGAWYHDVTIYCSGNTIVLSLDAAQAEQVRGLVMDQVLGRGGSAAPPAQTAAGTGPSTTSGDEILAQIHKLAELRDAGILTQDEFDSKKAELLKRL